MADYLRDVLKVETTEALASTMKDRMLVLATDSLRLIWKLTGGTLVYFWDATAMADRSGAYGAALIGCPGIPGIPPNNGSIGTPGDDASLLDMLVGMGLTMSRMVHVDTTPADWSTSPGGVQTLHSYTLPGGTISNSFTNQSLKIRVALALDDASTKIITLYGGSDVLATITTTEAGSCVFDVELVNESSVSQLINGIVQAGQDQNPSILQSSFDMSSDVIFRVDVEVTGGITGDASYRSMTIEYRGTIGL